MSSAVLAKLKVNEAASRLVLGKPDDIVDFDGLDYDVKVGKKKYNVIFAFIFSLDEFTKTLKIVIDRDLLATNGVIYFIYPKKGNKQYKQYIGRDDFFTSSLIDKDYNVTGSNLRFNKMCAFSEVFTCIGLKNLEKPIDKSKQPSQCVADYVDRIPDLLKLLAKDKKVLEVFNGLTPGYQRGWARYVYSVKTAETSAKRLAETIAILKQGFKSTDLYKEAMKKKA